eukprot:COSAG02_NODE_23687_length_711_cov_0.929739_2_plen_111_part_00
MKSAACLRYASCLPVQLETPRGIVGPRGQQGQCRLRGLAQAKVGDNDGAQLAPTTDDRKLPRLGVGCAASASISRSRIQKAAREQSKGEEDDRSTTAPITSKGRVCRGPA